MGVTVNEANHAHSEWRRSHTRWISRCISVRVYTYIMRPRSPGHLKRSRTSSALGIVQGCNGYSFEVTSAPGKIGTRTLPVRCRCLVIGGLLNSCVVVDEFCFVIQRLLEKSIKVFKYLRVLIIK